MGKESNETARNPGDSFSYLSQGKMRDPRKHLSPVPYWSQYEAKWNAQDHSGSAEEHRIQMNELKPPFH